MEEYNIIGRKIFFGKIDQYEDKDGKTMNTFVLMEGTVKDVICFDAFTPKEIYIDGELFDIPISTMEYWNLVRDKDNKDFGYFLCDMSRASLILRLCKRYNALLLSKQTLQWMLDWDEDTIPFDEDDIPDIYTYKDRAFVYTSEDISILIEEENDYPSKKELNKNKELEQCPCLD